MEESLHFIFMTGYHVRDIRMEIIGRYKTQFHVCSKSLMVLSSKCTDPAVSWISPSSWTHRRRVIIPSVLTRKGATLQQQTNKKCKQTGMWVIIVCEGIIVPDSLAALVSIKFITHLFHTARTENQSLSITRGIELRSAWRCRLCLPSCGISSCVLSEEGTPMQQTCNISNCRALLVS